MDTIEKTVRKESQNKKVPENIVDRIFGSPQETMRAEMSEAENVSLIIEKWLDKKFVKLKTRLTPRQVNAISILQSLADTYQIKTLDRFLMEFRTSKLSENSKSSEELENILKARVPNPDTTNIEKLSRFLE